MRQIKFIFNTSSLWPLVTLYACFSLSRWPTLGLVQNLDIVMTAARMLNQPRLTTVMGAMEGTPSTTMLFVSAVTIVKDKNSNCENKTITKLVATVKSLQYSISLLII